jgi:hypothetical protein
LTSTTGGSSGVARAARTAREATAESSAAGGGVAKVLESEKSRIRLMAWKSVLPATQKILASCAWYAAIDLALGRTGMIASMACTSSTVRYACARALAVHTARR